MSWTSLPENIVQISQFSKLGKYKIKYSQYWCNCFSHKAWPGESDHRSFLVLLKT